MSTASKEAHQIGITDERSPAPRLPRSTKDESSLPREGSNSGCAVLAEGADDPGLPGLAADASTVEQRGVVASVYTYVLNITKLIFRP